MLWSQLSIFRGGRGGSLARYLTLISTTQGSDFALGESTGLRVSEVLDYEVLQKTVLRGNRKNTV